MMPAKKDIFQPEGNYYDKYASTNFIIKKLMNGFFSSMDLMLIESKIAVGGYCLEAGCGEGKVIDHIFQWALSLGAEIKFSAFDLSEKLITKDKKGYPRISFFTHNIYEPIDSSCLPFSKQFDLIICSEVLEHLGNPQKAVCNLMNYGSRIIISVPNEPIWRILNILRGKYIRSLGNTPGHIQHFSEKEFKNMLKECDLKVKLLKKPLPWIIAYCEKTY